MDQYIIKKEKYNQMRNKQTKRFLFYFAISVLTALIFLSIDLFVIKMDFLIPVISMAITLAIIIPIIYFILKKIIKINDEIVLNTIYKVNEENIIISNNGDIIIEKNIIKKIEHYRDNSIGIFMNKHNRKIIYSNYIDNYNEFYEKLNKLHEIQEYKNRTKDVFIGIFGSILVISILAIKQIFPHKIYGLFSVIFIYGLLLILFILKSRDKLIEKRLRKFYIIGIVAMIIILLRSIFKYISKI
ncbi:hypothetical protein AGMMS49579_16610 [Spirochaetia bacterium]|nr:hypothetical protein AGMMS49579_16610 [Spirochaetia bacterium]